MGGRRGLGLSALISRPGPIVDRLAEALRHSFDEYPARVGIHDSMNDAPDKQCERLVVTGRQRDRLLKRFEKLFFGRGDVEVIKDRRYGERRGPETAVDPERRSRDRRQISVHSIGPPA